MSRRPVALVALATSLVVVPGAYGSVQGAVKLDNYTFDKFVTLPGVTTMVKVDKAYAYGEKEDAFKEVCKLAFPVKNFLVAELPVQEYGDKENEDVQKRLNVKTEEFPAFLLFKGSTEGTRFAGFPDPSAKKPATWDDAEDGDWEPPMISDITAENLALWLRQQGVKMPSIGTITELDEVAKRFMKGGSRDKDLAEAKSLADGEHKTDRKAPMYVKIMQKITEKGDEYPEKELARVQKILAGKVTPEKKEELSDKVKILRVFATKE